MKWTRRQFSIGGSAAALASLTSVANAGAVASLLDAATELVVFEPGVAASETYARQRAQYGAVLLSSEDDIGVLWHNHIRHRLADGASVSGITRYATRFLVETLARDSGSRFRPGLGAGKATPAALFAWQVQCNKNLA